jgi:hypothetical protein
LEALDSRRPWRKRSVDSHISRLRTKGIVRRVKKSQNRNPAVYVRVGVETEPLPFEDVTVPEVVREVLGDRSMRAVEMMHAMKEAGYQTKMGLPMLRVAVRRVLNQGDFVERGGKWERAR